MPKTSLPPSDQLAKLREYVARMISDYGDGIEGTSGLNASEIVEYRTLCVGSQNACEKILEEMDRLAKEESNA